MPTITTAQAMRGLHETVGTDAMLSLTRPGGSRRMGNVTMPTMIAEIKHEAKKMGPNSARLPKGRNASGRRVLSAKTKNYPSCSAPCPMRGNVHYVRNPRTCRCAKAGGAAARRNASVCMPRRAKNGTMYQTVAVHTTTRQGTQRTSCVKAGGRTARDSLHGNVACPQGKTLITYTRRYRDYHTGAMTSKKATRCVRAVGALKDCPFTQVLVSAPGSGQLRGTNVRKCMKPETASAKGYRIIKAGGLMSNTNPNFTVPPKKLQRRRKSTSTTRPGTPRRRGTKRARNANSTNRPAKRARTTRKRTRNATPTPNAGRPKRTRRAPNRYGFGRI